MPSRKQRYCVVCGAALPWRKEDERMYCVKHEGQQSRTIVLTDKARRQMDEGEMWIPRWLVK